jgi:enoyl-[acyl-carrier protein] reductase II
MHKTCLDEVVQELEGVQAGGHVKSTTRSIELLHQVKRAVDSLIVLAAGGIADGAGVVRALANGAEGVCVGSARGLR